MIKRISITDYIEQRESLPLFDTRTPAEFEKGHIPGAHNLPIFSNEERIQVGTTYKKIGREAAILLGFDLVGVKWSGFIKTALEIAPQKKIVLHCWRGGMRSGAMAWALDFYGFNVSVIEGGYKSYRNWVLATFDKKYPLYILGGLTGSHKTEILQELGRAGEQIIDLEGLAQHHGSAYGSMSRLEQPSQEQFENNLAANLGSMDIHKRIWLEDESASIGKINLPRTLWNQMQSSHLAEIRMEIDQRVSFLNQEYGALNKGFLISATERICKRLGPLQTKNAITAIQEGRMEDFIRIVLVYYDKNYKRCLEKRQPNSIYPIEISYSCSEQAARQLLEAISKFKVFSI